MKTTQQLIQTIEDIFNDYRNSELFEAKANACADASLFMGEMLDKTDSLTEAIGNGLRELADAVRELAAAVAESRTATARKLV